MLGTQLRALLVKNWRLQQRNRADLVREIVWPVLMLMVLVMIRRCQRRARWLFRQRLTLGGVIFRSSVKNKVFEPRLDYATRPVVATVADMRTPSNASEVLFSPCQEHAGDAVWTVGRAVAQSFGVTMKCFATPAQSEGYYRSNSHSVLVRRAASVRSCGVAVRGGYHGMGHSDVWLVGGGLRRRGSISTTLAAC
jgi:hypothetical protein